MLFKEKPKDFSSDVIVVACYLRHNSHFVLLKRRSHKPHGGKWGLPAGKVDAGETLERAVFREVMEETGVEISGERLRYLGKLWVRQEQQDFEYHSFAADLDSFPEITLSNSEHQDHQWVSPKDCLHMDLVHDLDECNKLYFELL